MVTLADFSDTLVGEIVEARAVGGLSGDITTTNGFMGGIALHALGRGGAIITQLDLYAEVPDSATLIVGTSADVFNVVRATGPPTDLVPSMAALGKTDVGSSATASILYGTLTENAAFPSVAAAQIGTREPATANSERVSYSIQPGTRWWVAPGSSLFITLNARRAAGDNIPLAASITWRELAPAAR